MDIQRGPHHPLSSHSGFFFKIKQNKKSCIFHNYNLLYSLENSSENVMITHVFGISVIYLSCSSKGLGLYEKGENESLVRGHFSKIDGQGLVLIASIFFVLDCYLKEINI